ncbi:hypothetical protein [Phenylobacterium sp.]|uniref:hypothetical protein n=1 Tax=Phenylobacterium sp. TaxID=1871053 RepID=UPI0035B3FEAB
MTYFNDTKKRQLEIVERLLRLLPFNSPLRRKIDCCETDSLGYYYTCRQPACYRCRQRYIRRQSRAAIDRFGRCAKSDLAFFTVVLGGAEHPEEIGDLIARARSTLRNVFTKHRAQRKRWADVELVGWFEIDALGADDAPLLGQERADLISDLGIRLVDDRPTYIPTIHGIVGLNGLDHQQFRDALAEKWPAARQVDVRPFYDHASKDKSISCIVRYALKRTCTSFLKGIDVAWPDSWLIEFETWQFHHSRSFQSMKVSVGRKKPVSHRISFEITNTELDELEPMPFTC